MPNWKLFRKVNLDSKRQTTDYFLQINWLAVTTKNKVGICICFPTHDDDDDAISRQVFTSHFRLLKCAAQRQSWFCILLSKEAGNVDLTYFDFNTVDSEVGKVAQLVEQLILIPRTI